MKMKINNYVLTISVAICIVLITSFVQINASEKINYKFDIYLVGATPAGGGVWDMIGAGFADIIMRSNKNSTVTVIPGNGVVDVPIVSKLEAEIGLTHSSMAEAGFKGIEPYDQKYENIRGICSLFSTALQFIVDPKLKLENISLIKENKIPLKIAVGDPGSTGELATRRLLEAYGITYRDIESWGGKIYLKDMSEAAEMFSDGIINTFVIFTLAPCGPVQEVAINRDIQILPIDERIVQEMVSSYGYTATIIPKGTYGLTKDIESFSSQAVLITSDEQAEELIYNITRALVENLDDINNIHINLKNLTIQNMSRNIGAPLHQGAEKYYQEVGAFN